MTSTQTTSPHFCHSACYAAHATTRDLAVDAAELCQDAEHFDLYSDGGLTEAHVNAHETEGISCEICGLAIEPIAEQLGVYRHIDRSRFISNWPGHYARPIGAR